MIRPLPMVDDLGRRRALRMAGASAAAVASAVAPPPRREFGGRRPEALADRFGRAITYLRVSVTDRCNLRCTYCAPASTVSYLERGELLTDDEVIEVIRALARRGLRKVRFTGGEPLVRPGFLELVARLARAVPEVVEAGITTNGVLLGEQAAALRARGVTRFNISLDTLDPDRYRAVTGGGELARALAGLDAALAIRESEDAGDHRTGDGGLSRTRVKVNAVLMKGVNDVEVERLARLSVDRPLHVRFIELMPHAHCGDLHDAAYLSSAVVVEALARAGAAPVERGATDGPASVWRLPGARGTVGVIAPVSDARFCDSCNRVRLGADGMLRLCLFGDEKVDLRRVLRRRPRTTGAIDDAIDDALAAKPRRMSGFAGFAMRSVGG